ncbi:MAG: AraC family transcriptional regulator [Bacteroidetes bacterium MedPE-SWsnd-G1]|nr:MAG: AraC family transcriptional regulator [Bacteroidetes bacterium MedPE-SWsnd-G1]
MENTLVINSVSDYCNLRNYEVKHSLIAIVDFNKVSNGGETRKSFNAMHFNCYAIFLKDAEGCKMMYGGKPYDYDEGTLVFLSPNQTIKLGQYDPNFTPKGYAILFHPDLLLGTDLFKKINTYGFFSYESNEALHISAKERKVILSVIDKIQFELDQNIDKHSKNLITSNLELFLDYCTRFYNRQFITRAHENQNTIDKFETLLNDYFKSKKSFKNGLPSVNYFADELCLSPNYFGDLVKNETGKSAQEHIQLKLINLSKNKMFNNNKSISEIAFELGFKYPQHFSRMFKKSTGLTPKEFRTLNN